MARKRLTKGANALRVEERIARVPADLGKPRHEGSGVFEALRLLERESEGKTRELSETPNQTTKVPATETATHAGTTPRRSSHATKQKTAISKPTQAATSPDPRKRLGPDSFTKAERRAIIVSCVEYRNRLPTYLKSAMREVEIIDSILRKCERVDDGREDG